MMIAKQVICALMILGIAKVTCGQGYRGIVPLHSTCEDVKRVLGMSRCDASSTYKAVNERVNILFSKVPCDKAWQKSWNVPPGTVLGIERSFIIPVPLSDLKIALSKFEKNELTRGESSYRSDEAGMIIIELGGMVSLVAYTPTPMDEYLVCSGGNKPERHEEHTELPTRWFDRYGDLPFSKEKKRLDILAEELRVQPPATEVYYVLYYTSEDHKKAALARGERAKKYLAKTYEIDTNRIKTIDGGVKDEFEVVVYIK